jgi:restriction endonuclease S subunit
VSPGINRNEVYNIDVYAPDIKEQKEIAEKINKLSTETEICS